MPCRERQEHYLWYVSLFDELFFALFLKDVVDLHLPLCQNDHIQILRTELSVYVIVQLVQDVHVIEALQIFNSR